MDKMAIRIQSLTRDFDGVRALDGLSLEVPGGIIFGFLGPNGAGGFTHGVEPHQVGVTSMEIFLW